MQISLPLTQHQVLFPVPQVTVLPSLAHVALGPQHIRLSVSQQNCRRLAGFLPHALGAGQANACVHVGQAVVEFLEKTHCTKASPLDIFFPFSFLVLS